MTQEAPRFSGRKLRKRDLRVAFRVTPSERRQLLAAAMLWGITVSELVRKALREAGLLESQD